MRNRSTRQYLDERFEFGVGSRESRLNRKNVNACVVVTAPAEYCDAYTKHLMDHPCDIRITSTIQKECTLIDGENDEKSIAVWAEKRDEWRQRLTRLAIEFRDGHCPPTPQRDSTCLTCEFKDLCRI